MQKAKLSTENCNWKQTHCNLRYEKKSSYWKKYKPTATEKCKGFRILSEPTATKNAESKNYKEVTVTN